MAQTQHTRNLSVRSWRNGNALTFQTQQTRPLLPRRSLQKCQTRRRKSRRYGGAV